MPYAQHELENGTLFDARYVIRGKLGAGGFATVYLASSDEHGDVALKVLSPNRGDSYDAATRARFERETEILRALKSPFTVRLLAAGVSREGFLYLATEHIAGQDLSAYISRHDRLSAEAMLEIARQVLESLSEAHRAGLVHRDIKPGNIRVTPSPEGIRAVLLDFGIARSTDDGHPQVTATGELIGTPRYMSPEQLMEKRLTPRSDLYSFGLVMFEMLAGRGALPGNQLNEQIQRLRIGHELTAPDELIEPGLFRVIRKMTARRPEERYASADAVLVQLSRAVAPSSARRELPAARNTGRTAVVAGGVAALMVLMIVASALWTSAKREVPAEPVRPPPPARVAYNEPAPPQAKPAKTPEPKTVKIATPGDVLVGSDRSAGCGRRPPLQHDHPVRTPKSYDNEVPHPLLIAFHMDYVSPQSWIDNPTMRRLANEERVVIVAPDGTNPNTVFPHAQAWRVQDHVEVARWVRDEALAQFCIDPKRVYVLGHADGVRATRALSCEPWVAAAAHVGDALDADAPEGDCEPLRPMIWLHTSSSPRVPVETGPTCTGDSHLGSADVERLLRKRQGCTEPPAAWSTAGPGRTCRTHCDRLVFCDLPTGATWTGETQHHLDAVGEHAACSPDPAVPFDLTQDIWSFLSSHQLDADPREAIGSTNNSRNED